MRRYHFSDELRKWGPSVEAASPPSLRESEKYCRWLAQAHYENFPVVSWLLPRRLHQHFYNVYAYCRWADDLGDEVNAELSRAIGLSSTQLLDWWRDELRYCYSGTALHPVFVALSDTIQKFDIPQQPFLDLISAFQQDQTVTEYETFTQLHDYCQRSANPVGRLVLYLCGEFNEENARWSDCICTGLQLANFWQDVLRDAQKARIYLPQEDREQFGYSSRDFEEQIENDAFRALMKYQVDRTRELLLAGSPLIKNLSGRLKIEIRLFQLGGLRILEKIEQLNYSVWTTRPKLNKVDVLRLMYTAIFKRELNTG